MIRNKKKFTSGIKKILFACTLAFIGPVCFVLGSSQENNIILTITGILTMIGCLIIGVIGIKVF